jgi:hypothetical protein
MKTIKIKPSSLITYISTQFEKIPDHRSSNSRISLKDALMSAYAIYSMKIPSLLKFEEKFRKRNSKNLLNLYNVGNIPSDTQLRTIIDEVEPKFLESCFKNLFKTIQRQKKLEAFEFMRVGGEPYYLMPVDGTTHYSSSRIHCQNCTKKMHMGKDPRYYHLMVTAAIVHPNLKTVIPFAPEAVLNQDGDKKQDCEHKAFGRLIEKFKKNHPKLKVILCGDALYASMPIIQNLIHNKLGFIISVKDKGHAYLFEYIKIRTERGLVAEVVEEEIGGEKVKKKIKRIYRYLNGVPLNKKSSTEMSVNFIEYLEEKEWICKGRKKTEKKRFTWVTNININNNNLKKIVEGGRSRWKIENEVFNTLKNQGYHFEHNYGHGNKYLAANFSYLMTLAFFVDQIIEMGNKDFKRILELHIRKINVWDNFRSIYALVLIKDWEHLYELSIESGEGKSILNTS